MATFVFVHGAFGGSYGFRQVRNLLHGRGHEVVTPSLTGIGERSHLAHPDVDLATHIRDVANAIFYDDLTDIVLVGFSYGGMVVTGALDHIGDRVASLVFLDAFVPADGQAVSDLVALPIPEGSWQIPPIARELATPEATAWSAARRCPQPVRTITSPVSLSRPLEDWGFALTYIKATADPSEPEDSPFWEAARHAEGSPRWGYFQVDCNHMIPQLRPDELADIVESLL